MLQHIYVYQYCGVYPGKFVFTNVSVSCFSSGTALKILKYVIIIRLFLISIIQHSLLYVFTTLQHQCSDELFWSRGQSPRGNKWWSMGSSWQFDERDWPVHFHIRTLSWSHGYAVETVVTWKQKKLEEGIQGVLTCLLFCSHICAAEKCHNISHKPGKIVLHLILGKNCLDHPQARHFLYESAWSLIHCKWSLHENFQKWKVFQNSYLKRKGLYKCQDGKPVILHHSMEVSGLREIGDVEFPRPVTVLLDLNHISGMDRSIYEGQNITGRCSHHT